VRGVSRSDARHRARAAPSENPLADEIAAEIEE
jgi:hypothetical protein